MIRTRDSLEELSTTTTTHNAPAFYTNTITTTTSSPYDPDLYNTPKRFRLSHADNDVDDDDAAAAAAAVSEDPQSSSEEAIMERCLSFLQHTQEQSRPKTLDRLSHAVQQICTFDYAVDAHVVFFHLVLNQILVPHDVQGVSFVSVNNAPTRPVNQFIVVVPCYSASNKVSHDFKAVLHKAVVWVQNNRGLRGKQVAVASFVRSLQQVCVVKKTALPEAVVATLLGRGVVSVDEQGLVTYHLPQSSAEQESHYMPVLCK